MKHHLYIGIDDTDNKESRGTGFRSRKLANLLEKYKVGNVEGISRHQLYVHQDIPFTSQNSSACMEVYTKDVETLKQFCKQFLIEDSADGSDVGLCIADVKNIAQTLIQYGFSAKNTVLTQNIAKQTACEHQVYLEGLSGTHDGIIGALAATGLRASGNDGRFIWLKNTDLRALSGTYTAREILKMTGINYIQTPENNHLLTNELIELGDWVRPVLQNNKKLIFVEKSENTEKYEWKVANKEYIKSISQ